MKYSNETLYQVSTRLLTKLGFDLDAIGTDIIRETIMLLLQNDSDPPVSKSVFPTINGIGEWSGMDKSYTRSLVRSAINAAYSSKPTRWIAYGIDHTHGKPPIAATITTLAQLVEEDVTK